MKYLGIDFGSKRVGYAVSDADGVIAFPRSTLPNDAQLLDVLQAAAAKEKVDALVMGDTLSHGGNRNTVSEAADAFAAGIIARTGLPLARTTEIWSSMEASRFAPDGHEHDDAAAAAFILQRFLDMHRNGVE